MEISKILFWQKYRPKDLSEIILIPRIRKSIESGINTNIILHGSFGCGKSSLARILCKDRPNLSMNSSFYTSVETLRNQVDDFCSTMSMFDSKDDLKIVYLDEIDRVSKNYQDALKGFIEHYEKNVRFIATTNHINKIDGGVKSRLILIDFNPQNQEEEKYLYNEYAKRISSICTKEEITLSKDNIVSIVKKNFPDLRQMVTVLQHIKLTVEFYETVSSFNQNLKVDLYKNIISNKDAEETYHLLMDNFGDEKIDEMLLLLGRPFIEWIVKENRNYIKNIGKVSRKVTEYSHILNTCMDPIVLGVALLDELKEILNDTV